MLLNHYTEDQTEAGCDEAGRGCLAGPVFAAAVILPRNFRDPTLNDSKQLSEKVRDKLRIKIEQEAIAWAVASIGPEIIDEINILNASILCMHHAVSKLNIPPEYLLIDGNRFKPYPGIAHQCFVKGDGRFLSIAAASVLAKTWRDEHMRNLARDFPMYGWDKNKGYPTKMHRDAIVANGTTPHHRMSFNLYEPIRLNI
jgi:ribonuclease HII